MNRALMLVLLAVLAIAATIYVYPILLMTVLSYVVFASSFNLLLGYAGLLCFGHAMFFGTAAYFAGWLLKNTALSIELCFLLSALSMAAVASRRPPAGRVNASSGMRSSSSERPTVR